MPDMIRVTSDLLHRVRSTAPLVHNITNFVVMNSSANTLLAVGAAPVMAHCIDEVEEMVQLAGALVLNIGTIEPAWLAAMLRAGQAANQKGIPVVLDPVGAGATRLRTAAVERILAEVEVAVLRGNASEIFSLGRDEIRTRGVDSSLGLGAEVVAAARALALGQGCVVAISGERDLVTDGSRVFRIANGQPLMTRVTGMGCGLSALTGAFCAVADGELLAATAAAFGLYGLCGDLAIEVSDRPGSFAVAFLDALFSVGREEIGRRLLIAEE
ncbi:hydroxyethylthiazole kinase [Desulfuromonas carbonis]|uniref:hydroxyethylthiazole kinase n=1 Tax=Desulfuromonas sp. DDH964 TaxID=1823759 RepID=UPI00078BC136|nr:hydroxyethylthiazole kinase [Desulfuromonas sp. DDH964]AMV73274.1 Hydroxyethylthiazole kinase [Desulfuromonas sp. DDH964]